MYATHIWCHLKKGTNYYYENQLSKRNESCIIFTIFSSLTIPESNWIVDEDKFFIEILQLINKKES